MNYIYKLLLKRKVYKFYFALIIIMGAINSFMFSKIILLSGDIINIYLGKANYNLSDIIWQLVIISALWSIFNIFYYVFTNNCIEKNLANIRNDIIHIILNGDIYELEKNMHTGNISLRTNSDIEKLGNILTGDFLWILRVMLNALFALISCIILDFRLSLVFAIFPISFLIIKKLSRPIRKRKKNSAGYMDQAMTLMIESLQGLSILKSFNLEKKIIDRFDETIDKAKIENIKNEKTNLITIAINYIVQIIQLAVLLLVGIFMIYNNYILPGNFIVMLLLSNNVRFAVRLLSDVALFLHETAVLSERILEVFEIKTEKKDGLLLSPKTSEPVDCLSIENLYFKYEKQNIFNDISLKIQPGEKVAILGKSGCGKSTLIKLICGFYEDYHGQIKLYQKDIKNVNKNSLRDQIAIITQEAFIISESIYENIVLYNKDIKMEQVLDVIEKCCLKDLIESLPEGLNTLIGDGGINLSQGEKQRISIARAIIKNSSIVIMDEATASLDYKTEESILVSFGYLLKNKTAIIITHRPNILKLADKKYIMQSGKLILC